MQILAAFAAIYLLWGSTYLFIRFGVETIPPFLMAGTRHLVAGSLLLGWVRLRTGERPRASQWLPAAIAGTLLLVGGNGGVTWAEQRVPSGLAALLVATMPLWLVLLDWLRPWSRGFGIRPRLGATLGLLLGFGGVALLVGPSRLNGTSVDPLGATVLVLAALSWAIGSLFSRHGKLATSPLLAAAMQSLCGGAILIGLGGASGEWARLDLAQVSLRSILSLAYLVLFGSLLGFTAYIWLLRVTTPSRVSTYAYVNPVVAVLLGWAFAGEAVTGRMIGATALIVVAVALVITQQRKPEPTKQPQAVPANAAECAD